MSDIEFYALCCIFCPSVVAVISMHPPYMIYGIVGVFITAIYIYIQIIIYTKKG